MHGVCGSPLPRWGYFLCYTSSVFEMEPSLTSEKPVEGALPRKGHVAQLMRGSCRPPGFEKGACNCPGEKFSRVVRAPGDPGALLGDVPVLTSPKISTTCHICFSPGNQPTAFLCPNLPHANSSAQLMSQLLCPLLSLLTSKTYCLLICHIFLETFLTNPQYQPHSHPQDWNRYFISTQHCLFKKITKFPSYNTSCCYHLVTKSCPTPCDPILVTPGSSVHGILQVRILEWVAISYSRGSSWPRDPTLNSCLAGGFFTTEPAGKPVRHVTLCSIIFLFH